VDGKLQVVVLCDTPSDAIGLRAEMYRGGFDVTSQWAENPETFKNALEKNPVDLVLCDTHLSQFSVIEARQALATYDPDIPFIVVTGPLSSDAKRIASQFKAGISDLVEWGNPEQLTPAVERELNKAQERRQQRLADAELRHRASYDTLTGLPNRTLMFDRLNQGMKHAKRDEKHVILMFIDLDYFKWVNDSLGHLAGDELLQIVAKRISKCLRESDTAARIGGDEFAIVLDSVDSESTASIVARKLLSSLSRTYALENQEANITASIGISIFPQDGEAADVLLNKADKAMYYAKSKGRNAYKFHSSNDAVKNGDAVVVPFSRPREAASPPPRPGILQTVRSWPISAKISIGIAAAIIGFAVVTGLITPILTSQDQRMAKEEDSETLKDFGTASGPDDKPAAAAPPAGAVPRTQQGQTPPPAN